MPNSKELTSRCLRRSSSYPIGLTRDQPASARLLVPWTVNNRMMGMKMRMPGGILIFMPIILLFAGGFNRRRIYCGSNPDRLDIHELVNAERGKFTAIATALDAAKRKAWIGCGHTIDEDRAGFQPTSQP